jgi:class 3 adenylate cyclase
MTADTQNGVRLREPAEMRRVALLGGLIYLANGLVNPIFASTTDVDSYIDHPGLFPWVGVAGGIAGIVLLIASLALSDSALTVLYPLGTIAVLGYSIVLTPLFMWVVGYPNSGIEAMTYTIVAILAFYLLARWLAIVMVSAIVVAHGWLEVTSNVPWPAWLITGFVAVVLLVVGYFIALLMEQLERSRDAEHNAATELADLNHNLEAKVAEQVGEVERLGRLRRFLSAPVAEAVLTSSDESKLAPHRREIAVLFCDLRGFTAFTKQVEPEEVMEVLEAYHTAAGEQITKFQATLGSFEGDGLMAYLNDPVPCDEPARRVVEMGLAIADAIDALTPTWHRRGYDLSYGIGMALGHATLGIVGYDGRSDYTALGTVVNLGARLCGTARARELVVDRRVFLQTEDVFTFTRREPAALKGFGEPVGNYLVDRT